MFYSLETNIKQNKKDPKSRETNLKTSASERRSSALSVWDGDSKAACNLAFFLTVGGKQSEEGA